jgi:lysylphosphatidylglycerol synthetase-like protein (DUF2156 family)
MARKLIDAILERAHIAAPDAEVSASERARLVRLHGNFSLAYATLRPDEVSAFGDARGYIAYGQRMGYAFALGDPIAAAEDRPRLIRRFIERFGEPCFVQASESTARLLAAENYRVTPFGLDTVLPLATYTFAGREKEGVRHALNWLNKRGYRIEEKDWSDDTAATLAAISQEWRGSRIVHREMRFLNRSFPASPEPDVRIFVLTDPAGQPVAFLLFDPLYADGRVIGYVTALKRRLADASAYAELGLTRHAVEAFKREGMREVRLGLSPLAPTPPSPFRENPLLGTFLRATFRSSVINRRIFNLAGQAAYKRRFHGVEEPLYMATRRGLSALQLIAVLRLSKLI